MGAGQPTGPFGIRDANRKFLEPLIRNASSDVGHRLRVRQFAEPLLGRDFPSGRGTHEDIVAFVGNRLEGSP